jgi:beta-mannosidase
MFKIKKSLFFTVVNLLTFFSNVSVAQLQPHETLSLTQWQFKQQNTNDWLPAYVPGNVHTDLLNAGIIPSLYKAGDDKNNYWIETKNWEYQTIFEVSPKMLQHANINLHCKGLDTYASIFLNDIAVATSANMFMPCIVNIKNHVKAGSNHLKIVFEAPVTKIKPIAALAGHYPIDNDTSRTNIFTRKAAYHYGWDFAPRMVTMGIWQPIFIDAWTSVDIKEVNLKPIKISNKKARYEAIIDLEAPCDEYVQVIVKDYNNSDVSISKLLVKSNGNDIIKVPFTIENPQIWQPNGSGKQMCYNITVEAITNNELAKKSTTIGVRSVSVINENDRVGKNFILKVNGNPLYVFGANYTPLSMFNGTVTRADYEKLFTSLKDAGINMLRVWGGGVYEDDYFYQLADENGILIWHDFMFAGAMYPADSAFLQSITSEAAYQVKRLRNHPCMALWCGNNEIDVAWKNWGWQKTYAIDEVQQKRLTENYKQIFEKLLPSIINRYDSGRFYMHSSPQSNWGRSVDFKSGNNHVWGVWHGDKPIDSYFTDVPRFASEFGMPSMPNFSTMKAYTNDNSVDSAEVTQMLRSYKGFQALKKYVLQEFNNPETFSDWIYATQSLQAEAVTKAITAQRMQKPFCMGSMYWQAADCWPGITWAAIDFNKNKKAIQYKLPQVFSKYAIAAQCSGQNFKVALVDDANKNVSATIELFIKNFEGVVLWHHTLHTKLRTSENIMIHLDSLLPKIKQWGLGDVFFMGIMYNEDGVLAKHHYFFDATKNLNLIQPKIITDVCEYGPDYMLTLQSPHLIKNVYCMVNNTQASFSNNYFDMLPNETQQIIIRTGLPINQLIENLILQTPTGLIYVNK